MPSMPVTARWSHRSRPSHHDSHRSGTHCPTAVRIERMTWAHFRGIEIPGYVDNTVFRYGCVTGRSLRRLRLYDFHTLVLRTVTIEPTIESINDIRFRPRFDSHLRLLQHAGRRRRCRTGTRR